MSDYEQRDDSGAMFVNERKTTAKHPDRNGSCKVGGVEYWVSGWIKEGKNGKKPWLSLSFTPKEAQSGSTRTPTTPQGGSGGYDPIDDDIPF